MKPSRPRIGPGSKIQLVCAPSDAKLADAMVMDTTQSAVSYNIDRRIFDNLPKSRSFDSMITVAPGARMEDDGGGYQLDGASGSENTFVINGVTGPDEYTTVVNDNLYTNVMARFNLRYAARTVRFLAQWNPDAFASLQLAGRQIHACGYGAVGSGARLQNSCNMVH